MMQPNHSAAPTTANGLSREQRGRAICARVRALLIGLSLVLSPLAWSQASPQRWEDVERVVVFGDVHGAYDNLLKLLRYLNVINQDNHWSGGVTHLVSLGDLLDRGPNSRAAMDLLMRLQQEALAAGGRVHVVLGNHEVMNLTGDLRYVSVEEYAAFAPDESDAQRAAAFEQLTAQGVAFSEAEFPPGYFAHRAAFAADGHYGRWLLDLPAMIVINDSAFVHAGFPDWMNSYALADINQQLTDDLTRVLQTGSAMVHNGVFPAWHDLLDTSVTPPQDTSFISLQESRFLGTDGPLWYRGSAYCHALVETPVVDGALAAFAVRRLIVGHSPTTTRKIQARFGGKVLLADTGMLTPYYHGQPTAVVMQQDQIQFAYADAGEMITQALEPAMDWWTHLPQAELSQFMQALEIPSPAEGEETTVTFEGTPMRALFTPGNKRNNAIRIAAFQLDQLLGLGMVPAAVARKIDGVSGTLSLLPGRTLTESERAAENIPRPQWCTGLPDYQLMYAFDALTANKSRTPDSMLYDRSDWSMILLTGDSAFTTGSSFPEYLDRVPPVLPQGLADRLRSINLTTLEQTLGTILSSRQIRAIDERRARLLDSWQVAD